MDFSKYKLDRDIPDNIYNTYLRKYTKLYRLKRAEDLIWIILCKQGSIQPDSLIKSSLLYYGSYNSPQGLTWTEKKLPSYCEIIAGGETEIVFRFPENKLPQIAELVRARKKRQVKLSEEQKKVLRERMKKINKKVKDD